jgi:hypothetical protein
LARANDVVKLQLIFPLSFGAVGEPGSNDESFRSRPDIVERIAGYQSQHGLSGRGENMRLIRFDKPAIRSAGVTRVAIAR